MAASQRSPRQSSDRQFRVVGVHAGQRPDAGQLALSCGSPRPFRSSIRCRTTSKPPSPPQVVASVLVGSPVLLVERHLGSCSLRIAVSRHSFEALWHAAKVDWTRQAHARGLDARQSKHRPYMSSQFGWPIRRVTDARLRGWRRDRLNIANALAVAPQTSAEHAVIGFPPRHLSRLLADAIATSSRPSCRPSVAQRRCFGRPGQFAARWRPPPQAWT